MSGSPDPYSLEARDLLDLAEVRWLMASGEGRALRERLALSTAEVGSAIGVSHVTVVRWESGERRPTGQAAIRYGILLRHLRLRQRAGWLDLVAASRHNHPTPRS